MSIVAAVLAVPAVAWAATDEQVEQINDIEVGLIALFPLVILISSLVLGPAASERAKAILPAAVGIIVAVIYFIVDAFPGFGADLLVEVGALVALAMRLYEPLSAIIRVVTGLFGRERSLNQLTGPGVVGRGGYIEGD